MNWRSRFVKTEGGWYVFYDEILNITYVMDEDLVSHIDSLHPRNQVDIIAKLFMEAGCAVGRNMIAELAR